ncbi:MAG TPA: type II secretion system protein GspF, partial [Deltaproteobacteria bacterium]|nr:type II secretion system protein GspF [Deltaproteobacteria bacterium]
MPVYSYQALDQDGQVVEGVIDADTESTVIANLRGQGRRPLSVSLGEIAGKSNGFSLPDLASLLGRDKVRTHDLALFTRELATLLRAGMPLDRSLQSLAGLSESEAMKTIVGDVLQMVREGKTLSFALTERPTVFPPLYVNMVRAGEAGGVLESVLERLADYMETSEKNREEIRSAMTYPAILGFVGSISIIILLTYVLPRFTVIFEDLGAAMPLSTRIVMGASEFIQNWWFMIIIAGV